MSYGPAKRALVEAKRARRLENSKTLGNQREILPDRPIDEPNYKYVDANRIRPAASLKHLVDANRIREAASRNPHFRALRDDDQSGSSRRSRSTRRQETQRLIFLFLLHLLDARVEAAAPEGDIRIGGEVGIRRRQGSRRYGTLDGESDASADGMFGFEVGEMFRGNLCVE